MVSDLFDLSGKTAIVTGGSRGIGEAAARRLAEAGARVVVASRDKDACAEVARSINSDLGREAAAATGCNVSRKEDLAALVAFAEDAFGAVDIVVSNAAANVHYGPSQEIDDAAFAKIMTANVNASHWLSQMTMPKMADRKDGVFIIVSSIAAFIGSSTLGAYGVSKAADLQIARNLAVEYGPSNVRANCICPGIVKTKFAEALWKDPKIEAHTSAQLPLRRFGEPDDIAGAVVFLASRAGAWMTGQQIVIDGGALVSMSTL
ncbi:MAG: SDR family oxidoreductase [Pseudomonadota bacterium]